MWTATIPFTLLSAPSSFLSATTPASTTDTNLGGGLVREDVEPPTAGEFLFNETVRNISRVYVSSNILRDPNH